MLKAVLKWTLILASLLAVGPLMAKMLTELRDVDGGRAATFFVNGDPKTALLCAAALIVASLVVGMLGARFYSLTTSMLCSGFVLGWAASSLGSLESIVRRAGDGRNLVWLAVEGLVVTIAAAGATMLYVRTSATHEAQTSGVPVKKASGPLWQRAFVSGEPTSSEPIAPVLLIALAAGTVAAAVLVWFVALSGDRTQTMFAAICGAIAAGAAAQLVTAGRGFHLTPVLPILSVALVALLGPIIAKSLEGTNLIQRVFDGSVLGLARPVSLDWATGALIGVPLGMGWAGAAVDKRHH